MPGVDSLFRLSLRGPAPAPTALAFSQLAVSVALLAKGFTISTSAAFAVVAAALLQGIDKSGAGNRSTFFRGKTVWITGASSGIGEAMAYACYAAGARVILSARRVSELERVRTAHAHMPELHIMASWPTSSLTKSRITASRCATRALPWPPRPMPWSRPSP